MFELMKHNKTKT